MKVDFNISEAKISHNADNDWLEISVSGYKINADGVESSVDFSVKWPPTIRIEEANALKFILWKLDCLMCGLESQPSISAHLEDVE